jgi:hypothetical protein
MTSAAAFGFHAAAGCAFIAPGRALAATSILIPIDVLIPIGVLVPVAIYVDTLVYVFIAIAIYVDVGVVVPVYVEMMIDMPLAVLVRIVVVMVDVPIGGVIRRVVVVAPGMYTLLAYTPRPCFRTRSYDATCNHSSGGNYEIFSHLRISLP